MSTWRFIPEEETVTLGIPTRGRPAKLKNCIESVDEKVNINIVIWAYEEGDVPEIDSSRFNQFVVTYDKDILTLESHNRTARAFKTHFLGLSDDIEFKKGAIGQAVYSMYRNFGSSNGVVKFTVSNMDSPGGGFMLLGNDFIESFTERTPYYPGYKFMFGSRELRDVAEKTNRFTISKNARLAHYHPDASGEPDETHRRIRSSGIIDQDRKIYKRRRQRGAFWGIRNKRKDM